MVEGISVGDVVVVKSGGPRMTVSHIEDRYGTITAWCVWFEKNKNFESTFPVVSLEKC
jgi:uncharacterized protein YodC (DUF2158 family)